MIENPSIENGALASSMPKLNKTVKLNLLVDDVSNEVTVKNESDKSVENIDVDLSRMAKDINLNINASDEEDSEDGELAVRLDPDSSE